MKGISYNKAQASSEKMVIKSFQIIVLTRVSHTKGAFQNWNIKGNMRKQVDATHQFETGWDQGPLEAVAALPGDGSDVFLTWQRQTFETQ